MGNCVFENLNLLILTDNPVVQLGIPAMQLGVLLAKLIADFTNLGHNLLSDRRPERCGPSKGMAVHFGSPKMSLIRASNLSSIFR